MWTIILKWRSERFSSKFIIWATVPKRRLTWQIDASVINCMDDEALAVYIPIYGDRIAARHICVQCLGASSTEGRWKVHYLKTKKKRMVIEGSDDDNNYPGTSTLKRKKGNCKNNKWAGKATRKVEVGWIHEGKQLRTSKGGNDYDESDTVGWGTKIGGNRDFISALKPQSMWMRKIMDWKTQTWTWMDNWMMCMEEMSNFIQTQIISVTHLRYKLALLLENQWQNQLNDTLPYQPVIEFDNDLHITSVILPISLGLITLNAASTIESSSVLSHKTKHTFLWIWL